MLKAHHLQYCPTSDVDDCATIACLKRSGLLLAWTTATKLTCKEFAAKH